MRSISGPAWAVAGFVFGSLMTVAILGRYSHIGKNPTYFTILDRLTGKAYQCLGGECEEIPVKENPQAKKTEAVPPQRQERDYRAELETLAACVSNVKSLPGSRSEFDVFADLAYETDLAKFGVISSPADSAPPRPLGPRNYRAELDALDYDVGSTSLAERSSLADEGFCGFIRAPTLLASRN